MDLRQLKYFVQIVETGSVSGAAELLRIAQPSLSHTMKNLEDELGIELFDRHPRGVRATELGQRFYESALRILREADLAKEDIRSQSRNPSGKVSIGLPTSACRGLCLPLFAAIREQQPNIDVHIVEAVTSHLSDYVHSGGLDVALLYEHKSSEHVAWTDNIKENLMLFVSPEHQLFNHNVISFRELPRVPIVLPGRRNVLRSVMEQYAARQSIELDVIDCDSFSAIVKLVSTGTYAAVMPHFAFNEELAHGRVIPIPIVDPTPSWRLSVVVSSRTLNQRGSAAAALVMCDVIANLVKAGSWQAHIE